MAIARKIAYNVIFNAIAKILSTVLALVAIGFITRYLGKEGFGDYSTVLAFFAFFGAFADLGLYALTAREISRIDADEKKILSNAIAIRALTSLAVFILTLAFVPFLPYENQALKIGIIIAAGSFVFSSTYMVLNGVFQKNLSMDKVAISEIIGKIIQVSIVILAVKYNLGFIAIVSAMLFAMMFNCIAVFTFVKRYATFSFQMDLPYWKKFLTEAMPLGISALVVFVYFKIDTIILSVMKTSADVGIYNAAYKVIENLIFFPSMIIGLVFPLLSRFIFSDRKRFTHIANETATVFFVLVVPLLIGTLFLSDGIIRLIGGNQFYQSADTLRILIFALAFIFFGNFFNNILIAANHQKQLLKISAFCALFNVSANILFIPMFSYTGSAVISVLTEMFVVLGSFYFAKKYTNYSPAIRHWQRILFSGLVMGLFLYFFNDQNFFLVAFSSATIYIFFLWATKTITIKELREIMVPSRSTEI